MAVDQGIAVAIVAGKLAGVDTGVVPALDRELEHVGAQAAEDRPARVQVHRVHRIERGGLGAPVQVLAQARPAAARELREVADERAIGVVQAVGLARPVAAVDGAIGGVGIVHLVGALLHLVVGVFKAEDEGVVHAAQHGVHAQVVLVVEIIHVLPAAVAGIECADVGTRHCIGVLRCAVARQAGELDVRRELVVHACGQGIDI